MHLSRRLFRFLGKLDRLPPGVRAAVVDSLYDDRPSLLIGSVAAAASAFVTAWQTSDPVLYLCTLAIALIGIARAFAFQAYESSDRARRRRTALRWHLLYALGAAAHVSMLGLWCLASFLRSDNPSVHLLAFSLTLAYLIGVSGRNFASRTLIVSQVLCVSIPMTAALIVAGPAYYPIIFLVLLPFFIAMRLITERLRRILFDAILTGRKAGEAATRLHEVLRNMAQGVSMFDDAQRLVVSNDRYAQMYGLDPEDVKPGTALRDVLERRIARGVYSGSSPENYLLERLQPVKVASRTIHEMSDGRAFAIARRPLPGGGWVATHEDITEQRRNQERVERMAHRDALTGLYNRILLGERIGQALAVVDDGGTVALHLVDLDLFKNVNDSLGHPTGDRLLGLVAARLKSLVRETDTIARIGGDEFAVLQGSIRRAGDIDALGRRIVDLVSLPYEIEGRQVVVGASVGTAVAAGEHLTPDELMRRADLALYRAKGDGRGRLRFFEAQMDRQMQERRSIEDDLRRALAAGEFELYYQPIVDLASNQIVRVEALTRWRHGTRGLLPPSAFIALAEEIGVSVALDEWAIREACRQAATWPASIAVAVNLSPKQFQSRTLTRRVAAALAEAGLAPERLELEITETSLLLGSEAVFDTLYRLREHGVRLALDDFGTGYSSLSHLQSFPFDRIKIDRSFIKDIGEHAGSLTIVRAVIALAAGLGMKTTAEGVETRDQLEILKAEGCTEMQGFLFSEPLRAPDLDRLLRATEVGGRALARVA
jgi:diguanylate cyclase (GGDEF)-like protein